MYYADPDLLESVIERFMEEFTNVSIGVRSIGIGSSPEGHVIKVGVALEFDTLQLPIMYEGFLVNVFVQEIDEVTFA